MKKITFLAATLFAAVSFAQLENGSFDTNLNDWTDTTASGSTYSVSSGQAFSGTGATEKNKGLEQLVGGFEDGKTYTVTINIGSLDVDANTKVDFSSGTASLARTSGDSASSLDKADNPHVIVYTATGNGDATIRLRAGGNGKTVAIDDVTITDSEGAVLAVAGYTVKEIKANAIAYYNLLGQEVANPVNGEVYIVKYAVSNGVATSKILF